LIEDKPFLYLQWHSRCDSYFREVRICKFFSVILIQGYSNITITFKKEVIMKKVKNRLILATFFLFISAGFSLADSARDASQLRGRDIAATGKIVTMKGILKQEGVEWVLLSSGNEYDIHMGPESYRSSKKFQLIEGNQAVVKGFLLKTYIAVMNIESNDKAIVLRDSSGRSSWAGSRFGGGWNSDEDHNHESGAGIKAPKDLESLDDLGSL
jgi:hypothetical protein